MAKPSSVPFWATSGDISEPTDPKKEVGWNTSGEKPARQVFNWFWNIVCQWIAYFNNETLKYYSSPEDLISGVEESAFCAIDSSFVVNPLPQATYTGYCGPCAINDSAVAFYAISFSGSPSVASLMFYDLEGNLINTVAPTSGVVLGICCDEDYFYVIEGSQTIAKYDNSGTIVSSFVLAGAHTNQSICTDGTNIYIGRKHAGAAPSFVACYSTNFSGSLVWIANDDENQKDLPSVSCLKNEDFVYVGVSGNANRNIFKIRKSDGVEVGEYQGTTDIDCLAVGESFILFSNSSGVEWVDKNFEFPSAFIHQSIVSTLRANAISYCGNDLFALAMKKDSTNDGVFCLYDERLKNQVYGLGNDSGQQTARAVASNGYLVCYAGQALIGLPGVLEHGIRVEPCRASGVLQKASVGERELASSVLK